MGREAELILAAQKGNVPQIERLLQGKKSGITTFRSKGVNPNCQDDSGYTPLHHAALNGQKEAVNVLLDYHASNQIPDNSGNCPLHLAAWKGDVDIARLLVHRGPSKATVNDQNVNGATALHSAAQHGHSGVIALLLQAGADPTLRNVKQESALDLSSQYDRLECVKLLLAHQPNLVLQNSKRHTPIHLAAKNGHKDMVELLLKHGMDVNVKTHSGSCLHDASLYGRVDVVQLLLKHEIDLGITGSSGSTAIDILDGHNSQKAADIRKLLQEYAVNKGLERHKRQSELLARQSLMDFGLPVSNGTAQNVSQTQHDPFGPIPAPRKTESDILTADYALLGEDVPTASTTAPVPRPRDRTKSVPPVSHKVPILDRLRSVSQSPTRIDIDNHSLFDDSSSLNWQTFERHQTMDSYHSVDSSSSPSDIPPMLPAKRRNTPAKPVRKFLYGNEEVSDKNLSSVPDEKVIEESPLSTTATLNPFSPPPNLSTNKSWTPDSDPFGKLEDSEPDISRLNTGTMDSRRSTMESRHSVFAGLHLGGSIEAVDVPSDIHIADAPVENDVELEGDDDWAQVEKLLVSVDDVSGELVDSLYSPLEMRESESLSKSIEDLTSIFAGPTGKLHSIEEFLERYTGLTQYADVMVASGFDEVGFLSNGILQESDLETIGISHQDDRHKIMLAIDSLPSEYHMLLPDNANSLGEWLNALKLAQYTALFIQHGFTNLDSVKGLYGLELDQVLPIHCLGHIRRLCAAICALKGVKKKVVPHSPPAASLTNKETDEESFLADVEPRSDKLSANVLRDYSQIKSKASPQLSQKAPSREEHKFDATDVDTALGPNSEERPERLQSDLPTIRPPLVAQLASRRQAGCQDEQTHYSPSDAWLHPIKVLLKSSANYVAKYRGSMVVTNVQGKESTKQACAKMRESTRHIKKVPLIVLAISAKGIKFIDGDSKMVIQEHDIRSISYCTQDREDLSTFAYINKDHITGKHYCHVFQAQTIGVADDIILTIGQAFEVAYQKIMQMKAKRDAAKFEARLGFRKGQGSASVKVKSSDQHAASNKLSTMGLGPTNNPKTL
ncbi:ankyrin repeat and sterile alpha motif domain-containing protein 1B-like isoform X2 [Corticium candelabrum]|uniref:ankyrin repeat and sterile alpha motif domain-containing protein 1B-like isoform X2 n=1 Tax=Corticium candelabrum TaxID=121492 RepID=UPI002E257927|nr:ankyrin repeat and sterile alpha motif domain-containing protein 1B-like isoform X2 [Corticium candelabrum]